MKKKVIYRKDGIEISNTEKDRGLGDLIFKITNPIASTIDKIAGTNIKGCHGCSRRRKKLNKIKL